MAGKTWTASADTCDTRLRAMWLDGPVGILPRWESRPGRSLFRTLRSATASARHLKRPTLTRAPRGVYVFSSAQKGRPPALHFRGPSLEQGTSLHNSEEMKLTPGLTKVKREYRCSYYRARYQRLKLAGLCTQCAKRPASEDANRCDVCRADDRRGKRLARIADKIRRENGPP